MRTRLRAWGLPLWDLLMGRRPGVAPSADKNASSPNSTVPASPATPARQARPSPPARSRTKPKSGTRRDAGTRAHAKRPAMSDRYDAMVKVMLAEHGVKVRKWRKAMSGVAWELKYHDGSVKRLIESPRPRGPMSAAIFLHEIGHHAIGFNRYKPRCLEEYHAWAFALAQMERHGLSITDAVRRRVHASLHYAIGKARRRGLASLPAELEPYVVAPPKSKRTSSKRAALTRIRPD